MYKKKEKNENKEEKKHRHINVFAKQQKLSSNYARWISPPITTYQWSIYHPYSYMVGM